jgi:hypothetical protein
MLWLDQLSMAASKTRGNEEAAPRTSLSEFIPKLKAQCRASTLSQVMPMEMLSTIGEIIRDLLIFVAVMTALLIVLVVVVSKMPDSNPLKRLLTALTYRVGATATAGALAIPVEPIPGIDVAYDFAVPILLIWYWFTFFRDTWRMSNASQPPGQRQIRRDGR